MLTLMCYAGTATRYTDHASNWGIHQVSDGPVPWYAIAKFELDRLPALIVECDRHPYEILRVAYGEAEIRAVSKNPPACERQMGRVNLRDGVLLEGAPYPNFKGRLVWQKPG